MGRLTPDERKCLVKAIKQGKDKNLVALVFGVNINTVDYWCKRAHHAGRESFKDLPRNDEGKITVEVELSILGLRTTFNWGCGRIQQGLINLPEHMLKAVPCCVQGVKLSRTAINNVLKKHGINGYERKNKSWKFFRAKKPNELWQLDIKGPFILQGKKYWFIVCIDDYSRYLLLAEQLDHAPSIKEIAEMLQPVVRKHHPKKILTDNNPFKEEWDKWCKENEIESLHAHPYYPQDKGKVERAIRNLAEEFIYLLKKFPEWINGMIKKYQEWYNNKRYHRGIHDVPVNLYY